MTRFSAAGRLGFHLWKLLFWVKTRLEWANRLLDQFWFKIKMGWVTKQ